MALNLATDSLTAQEGRDKALSILTDAFAISSAGIAALKTMEEIIPSAARTVENASQELTNHFLTLTSNMKGLNSENQEEILQAINGVTMGMQFQDRNTQIAENAVIMMERCRVMLEEVQGAIASILTSDPSTQDSVAAAVETILSKIRLSDVRTRFKETLAQMNIDYEDGLPPVAENSNNDIELF